MENKQKLLEILNEGLNSGNSEGWISEDIMKSYFKEKLKIDKVQCPIQFQEEMKQIEYHCKETHEPVYLEGDNCQLVIMDMETYNNREIMLGLLEQLLSIEEIRNKKYTIDELNQYLDEIILKNRKV